MLPIALQKYVQIRWGSRGRGAVPKQTNGLRESRRPPTRGRGSKLRACVVVELDYSRPPRGGRGSKPVKVKTIATEPESPPARGRGSKLFRGRPFRRRACRPPRGGVDRNMNTFLVFMR